jgi:hypothetical protein
VEPKRGAAEVEFFSDGNEIAQVAQLDRGIHMQNIIIRTNKILDVLLDSS